jgi:hypothetical protein
VATELYLRRGHGPHYLGGKVGHGRKEGKEVKEKRRIKMISMIR